MPNVPYPYEVNWQIGHRKWFLNTNLFLIKQFLIAKFDCTYYLARQIVTGTKYLKISQCVHFHLRLIKEIVSQSR